MVSSICAARDAAVRQPVKMLLAQTKWTECLHGACALEDALAALAEVCGARVALLHRLAEGGTRRRTVAVADLDASAGVRPLTHPAGPHLIAAHRPRPGSLWTLGDLARAPLDGLDERCRRWLDDRGIGEVSVIPLDNAEPERTLLELYHSGRSPRAAQTELLDIAEALAAAWAHRRRGLIARRLAATPALAEQERADRTAGQARLLSPSNPLGLTAAETRICLMIQCGYATGEILERSHISRSTLRTHLRNIYAKADVSGHIGLVRLLLAQDQPAAGALRA